MKRITYNGEPLVTGTGVTEALVHYVTHVAGMAAAVAVDIPVLERNGTVQAHTLILSNSTQLTVKDVDGLTEDESARFPVPELPPVGGQAFAMAPETIRQDAPFLDEDPLDLTQR
ncbi:hypothetical protein [Cryobacterium arcticum]|uniref:Uncharacterized protein n=1 Tax=Cryobacterium arcticum TaxID=670052 RepID=A0A317ZY30_9MICO|nr:hypothetical protein [Cryobacterium arcticum]PXA72313.1 hypothetical protein CTB96_05420 [Cryobacterium arcticum]